MTIETINPATAAVIKTYQEMSLSTAIDILSAAQQSFAAWHDYTLSQRADLMKKLAALLRARIDEYALLMTNEMGKPLAQSKAELEKCALTCLHYADHSEQYLAPRQIKTEMTKSFVTHEPLGLVFGIMPWNFPFWQVFRFAVPAMMAGNGAILKHAPISTGTALAIEALFADAGFPINLFRTLIISNDTAAEVIAHPLIAAVTFTGSVNAGKSIAATAGKALKKTVMELGGCDAYVILEDADLDQAVRACVSSRMSNAGQSCIAAKRLIVVGNNKDKLIQLLKDTLSQYVLGNPLDAATTMGPLARKDIRDHVHEQVQQCMALGAELVMGGVIPDKPGFYYPPTIISNIKPGMPAYEDEIFGPVMAVISARDEAEAIKIANGTAYGLGAGVFTKDIKRGEHIAAKLLQAGTCVVNTFVVSDPRLPFGGIKHSGYGRELAQEGILSFVNTKTVNVME